MGYDLIITCHEPYRVKFLEECLSAWDKQRVPGRKLVIADGFSAPYSRPGWEVVAGSWGHPSPARMAGMAQTDAPWIVFFDADNKPPVGYGDAIKMAIKSVQDDVGVICPSWKGGDARDVWGVDTNSPWRREAIEAVGGWEMTTLEDWRLGWKLQGAGWRIKRLNGPVMRRRAHPEQRTFEADINEKLWEARDFGIITLLRGDRALAETWLEAFEAQKKPQRLGLTVALDCDDEFRQWFKAQAEARLQPYLWRLTYLETKGKSIDATADAKNRLERHNRVAWLYQEAVKRTPEPWILTWEDDIEPLSTDLLYRMSGQLRPSTKVGSISPVYRERFRTGKACLSSRAECWLGGISMQAALGGGFREIGAHPAGFSLWRRSDLETLDAKRTWDFEACRAVRARGAAPHVFPEEVRHILTWAEGAEGSEIPLTAETCRIETVTI